MCPPILPDSFYTVSYAIAEESLKMLVWAYNNIQRYVNLSIRVDDKLHQDITHYKHTTQSLKLII